MSRILLLPYFMYEFYCEHVGKTDPSVMYSIITGFGTIMFFTLLILPFFVIGIKRVLEMDASPEGRVRAMSEHLSAMNSVTRAVTPLGGSSLTPLGRTSSISMAMLSFGLVVKTKRWAKHAKGVVKEKKESNGKKRESKKRK